jgi:hypothetical protein
MRVELEQVRLLGHGGIGREQRGVILLPALAIFEEVVPDLSDALP